jgi:3-hydroxyisobutyrate dehydrogenase-like beta-hydroxyacid dehydrogenase
MNEEAGLCSRCYDRGILRFEACAEMTMATTATRRTVAVIGTGDMGAAVGAALVRAGYRVITDSSHRSGPSRERATRAGLVDVGSLDNVVRDAELLLSIVPPAAALGFAEEVAGVLRSTRSQLAFADCNAVSPETVRAIGALFKDSKSRFVDAGIVGRGPGPGGERTRFYVSGAARRALLDLEVAEIAFVDLGERIGDASALKMAYAALNKGTDALHAGLLLAALRLGVLDPLLKECEGSQMQALARMRARTPFLGATAARFTGEMAEIAKTFAAVGVTPDFHRGAEWVYALIATTPFAAETRDTLPRERSLQAALAVYDAALEREARRAGCR